MADRRLSFVAVGVLLLAVLVATVFLFSEGQLFANPDQCEWQTPRHPDTNATFDSIEAYQDVLTPHTELTDEQVARHMTSIDIRVHDGIVQIKPKNTDCAGTSRTATPQ